MDENQISDSETNKKESSRILTLIQKYISEEPEFEIVDKLFENIGIDQDKFENIYSQLSKKPTVVLKRRLTDLWINQYNSILLEAWDRNIDIQFVGDAYGCVIHVLSYISKSEKELSALMEDRKSVV